MAKSRDPARTGGWPGGWCAGSDGRGPIALMVWWSIAGSSGSVMEAVRGHNDGILANWLGSNLVASDSANRVSTLSRFCLLCCCRRALRQIRELN